MLTRWWTQGFFTTVQRTKLHAFEMTGPLPSGRRAPKALCGYKLSGKGGASSPDLPKPNECCKICQKRIAAGETP